MFDEKKNFMDYFETAEEYPENIAENALPQGMIYEYVASSFLSGIVNYVEIFFACVIERYRNWDEPGAKRELEEKIAQLNAGVHTDYSIVPDDVLLLGETQNSYWLFWGDKDSSDCAIGRFPKVEILREQIKLALIQHIEKLDHGERPIDFGDGSIMEAITGKYIELPLPTGWICF